MLQQTSLERLANISNLTPLNAKQSDRRKNSKTGKQFDSYKDDPPFKIELYNA